MERTWFSKGLKGMIAKRIQGDLLRQGFTAGPVDKFMDGDFGGNTQKALVLLQAARSLDETGAVNVATWQQLTTDPLPTLFERCIGLTAQFEGHGFGLVKGNFDGAGLTWGIIGYTLSNDEVQRLLKDAETAVPGTLRRVMGPLADEWNKVVAKPVRAQVAWADSISMPPGKNEVRPDWKAAFARLGDEPAVKRAQLQKAYDDYFVPAAATARSLHLASELGVALCFDMHVQNGTSRRKAVDDIGRHGPFATELEERIALANAVADYSAALWREDVRARKLVVARGQGSAHRADYVLAAWGLDEVAAA